MAPRMFTKYQPYDDEDWLDIILHVVPETSGGDMFAFTIIGKYFQQPSVVNSLGPKERRFNL